MNKICFKVKDRIEQNDKTIILLSMYEDEVLPLDSISNVIAIDKNENFIWVIEAPTTKFDIYERVYYDNNILIAVSRGSQYYEIDDRTGKVISSRMIK